MVVLIVLTPEECLRGIADEVGIEHGEIFRLLREVLTGQEVSPPIVDVINILGRKEVIKRLEVGIEVLSEGL